MDILRKTRSNILTLLNLIKKVSSLKVVVNYVIELSVIGSLSEFPTNSSRLQLPIIENRTIGPDK